MSAVLGTRVPLQLTAEEEFDLAALMIEAHCNAFHDGVGQDDCLECVRLERHEQAMSDRFMQQFADDFVHAQDRQRFLLRMA
jgi:hypothetical protein